MTDDPARRGEALPRCEICSCIAAGIHAHENLWFLPHLDGTTPQPAAQEDKEHAAYLLGWREALDAMEDHIKKQREFLARVWGPKWEKAR